MANVKILPPEIVSKIAAGEVIERPASVVKELLENSLDAQANRIEIHLKQAGKTYIKIKDTGSGIEKDDIEKIFKRHSTSKIGSIDDLYNIHSLGFRGEALYSIAAIADVTLRSKTKYQEMGWQTHIRGGETIKSQPSSIPDGTEIEINELFYNTPARRKFLKSDSSELTHILNIVIPYTLLYNNYGFFLENNDKTIIDLPPVVARKARIAQALNLNSEYMIERFHEFRDEDIRIRLVLGDINIQRQRKDMQFIFINNRPVQNHNISYQMNQIYRLIFPAEVRPFFCIYIDIPTEGVDVNMHPTKREVKIRNEALLFSLLRPLCENTLMTQGRPKQIREAVFKMPDTAGQGTGETEIAKEPAFKNIKDDYQSQYLLFDSQKNIEPVDRDLYTSDQQNLKERLSTAQYIGTFINKYLLFETPSSILVIDQHAAQERITYEKLKKQIENGRIETQQLLSPVTLTLTPQETVVWENTKDILEAMGLSTTQWDKDSIALHTHPQLIKDPEIAIRSILSEETADAYDKDSIARRACRGSVMAGDRLDQKQIIHMRDELMRCNDPFTCPHGRPTVIEVAESFLNRQFLR